MGRVGVGGVDIALHRRTYRRDRRSLLAPQHVIYSGNKGVRVCVCAATRRDARACVVVPHTAASAAAVVDKPKSRKAR
jgi:hypothetical protein